MVLARRMAGEPEGVQREGKAVFGQRTFPLSSFSWQDREEEHELEAAWCSGGLLPRAGVVKQLGHRGCLLDYSFLLSSQRGFLKDVCFPPSSF